MCWKQRKKIKAQNKTNRKQERMTVQINEIKNKKAIEINKIKISTMKIKLHV